MMSAVDTIWVLLAAALVFFMQAGFAMVETGFTRAKNAGNIIMKNLMDFAIGTVVFWFIGFGIMFGSGNGFFGSIDLFTMGDYGVDGAFPSAAFIIFQTVFCATAATIVSGAMAERTKFIAYCIYSGVISIIIYPVSGHWIWGGGWLAQLGFHDFAGSTVVHMVGGVAAFMGALLLGPRIGKYDKNGKPQAIPGHSLTLGALGVFILWFGWFGFNGGSTVSMTGDAVTLASHIFVTTNLAAATATCVTMILTWLRYGKPDVSMTLNGSLAGLVAITAGCDAVSPMGAFFIGLIAAFAVVFGIEFIDRVLKIDDPVGAIGVHGVCGALGTILTGVFALEGGLVYGGGFHMVSVQIIGVLSVMAWVAATMFVVFNIIKRTVGLRVSEEEESVGLDLHEHGLVSAYADFQPAASVMSVTSGLTASFMPESETSECGEESGTVAAALPDENYTPAKPAIPGGHKITKVVIMCNPVRFEALKNAMNKIGVTGMTVTQVLGCGIQKGAETSLYRGVEMDINLIRKIKVEIVVSKVPVRLVIDTAREVLYTGNIGDGKIFLYDVENVIRVRTGDEGYDALQGEN